MGAIHTIPEGRNAGRAPHLLTPRKKIALTSTAVACHTFSAAVVSGPAAGFRFFFGDVTAAEVVGCCVPAACTADLPSTATAVPAPPPTVEPVVASPAAAVATPGFGSTGVGGKLADGPSDCFLPPSPSRGAVLSPTLISI